MRPYIVSVPSSNAANRCRTPPVRWQVAQIRRRGPSPGSRAMPPRRAQCRPGRGCRFSGPNSSTQRPRPGHRARRPPRRPRSRTDGPPAPSLRRSPGRQRPSRSSRPETRRSPRAPALAGPRVRCHRPPPPRPGSPPAWPGSTGKRQPMLGRLGLGDLLDLPPLSQREHRRTPARVPRIQRLKGVGAEVMQHVPDPVLAGKSQPGDLRHAHALRRPQHHLRPPPRHHRPRPAAHDPLQAIALVITDLTYSHPASHTRQSEPVNQGRELQKAEQARRKQGKRRRLRH